MRLSLLFSVLCTCTPCSYAFLSNGNTKATKLRILVREGFEQRNLISSSSPIACRDVSTAMASFEDFVFNAQSAASSLASTSLEDPSNILASIPVMYGAGLLTSVSPCVWGLLPLTMSYISAAAGEREDKETTLPTIAFAAGLASVFCSLGLIAATVGGALYGSSGNTNIVLPLFSNAVCCLMGFQLLELISLPLLSFQSAAVTSSSSSSSSGQILIDGSGSIISGKDKDKENGSLFRTFLLGGSSALVASPCATPVLTSILAFVANSSDPILGACLLLIYTLGYSTPLLIIAGTGGQALVQLKELGEDDSSIYAKIAPWVTPFTAGILLWYGTNGLLTTFLGDPSLAGLVID